MATNTAKGIAQSAELDAEVLDLALALWVCACLGGERWTTATVNVAAPRSRSTTFKVTKTLGDSCCLRGSLHRYGIGVVIGKAAQGGVLVEAIPDGAVAGSPRC